MPNGFKHVASKEENSTLLLFNAAQSLYFSDFYNRLKGIISSTSLDCSFILVKLLAGSYRWYFDIDFAEK